MLGAIIGDIVGSVYEYNTKDNDFTLFTRFSNFTDDTVMTLVVADQLLQSQELLERDLERMFVVFGHRYPDIGYGDSFWTWLFQPQTISIEETNKTEVRCPYGSWGNGSAMRVSSVGQTFDDLVETQRIAKISAAITHNHIEGIKGAQAVASCIFQARTGSSKEEIKKYIEKQFNYNLDRTWEFLHENYKYDSSCQGTVPEAIICFLTSHDFEDAIRRAISIGGDSDTQACITGGIAEAFYQMIPISMVEKALSLLPQDLKSVYKRFMGISLYGNVAEKYVDL